MVPCFRELYRHDCDSAEATVVADAARSLASYVRLPDIQRRIETANQRNKPSSEIQAIILDHARGLGFISEKQGLFSRSALRPDYFLDLGRNRGAILEVEKGKTLTNNMDILDLWKCHICPYAQYLVLMVPNIAANSGPRNVFESVVRRMQPFFADGNYINVYGLFILGY